VLNAPSWFYTVIVLPFLAGTGFFVFLLFIGKFSTTNKYVAMILTMLHEIRKASLSIQSVFLLGGSSFVIWLMDILVCYAVVLMFGQEIPFAVIALAIVIGNLT